ncbi:recQ-mediated genome instability protein 1-like [Tigriopus californicus]|uniref:recQ-mediated genome instability protein 1-like n=1 Tax=Tigriopus californicus TaxID=6832 RepID=UPI0027DA6239|nr:recQ-mediated genome instability protein 1-like [Tigriopus californicus]|eukprot:TCALIF_08376-PA protein Name:"Similar to rmi1 RecQ-mediated genome instability protein 1 (Xenopus laevis)" AED:0.45 eAED:0.46 QI:0/-1/0/1/-1/1/1/0/367
MPPPPPRSPRLALVKRQFERDHFHASEDWLSACVEWCQSEGIQDVPTLLRACQDQWLSTDIRAEGIQAVPPNHRLPIESIRRELKTVIPSGYYTFQVVQAVDVGSAAYGQLQRLNRVQDENSKVSAETEKSLVAAWEPKSSRMLKLWLHDGMHLVQALEHEKVAQIPDQVAPGLKLTLQGPIAVRRGLLFLEPKMVQVHGGLVEEMAADHAPLRALMQVLESGLVPEELQTQVRTHSTQVFQPRNRSIQLKPGGSLSTQSHRRTPGTQNTFNRTTQVQSSVESIHWNVTDDPFGDDDGMDDFLTTVEIPDFFDDDEGDHFLSTLNVSSHAPPASTSSSSRANRAARGGKRNSRGTRGSSRGGKRSKN